MAIVVGGVAVDLEASAAQYVAEMDKAARATLAATQRMQGSMGRWQQGFSNAERSINSSVRRVGTGLRSLQGFVAGLGLGLGAREIIRYSDAWRSAEAQLALVTGSVTAATAVHERLFGIAQNLGIGIEGLTTIYTRAARNADSLGVSQEGLLEVSEALGAAIRISGTSATEAQNALIQLSQSFASGALRGDELRSISEQMPVVLDAIAEATGKTRQEVINFARENGLAADLVVKSLRRQRDEWVLQADTIGGTVEQAMTRVENAIQRVAGQGGQAGAFQPLINSLDAFAQSLESTRVTSALGAFAAAIVDAANTIFQEFADIAAVASAVIEGRWSDAWDVISGRLERFGDVATSAIKGEYGAAVDAAIGKTKALGEGISKAEIAALYPSAATGSAAARIAGSGGSVAKPRLELRGGAPTAAELERIANATMKARELIADLITTSDEFGLSEQKLANKARDLGKTFQEFKKYVKDADEQAAAMGATLAALAVEEEEAALKIRETLTDLRRITEVAGLGDVDLGQQNIRNAVEELGAMAQANDDVFATQLALAEGTARLRRIV